MDIKKDIQKRQVQTPLKVLKTSCWFYFFVILFVGFGIIYFINPDFEPVPFELEELQNFDKYLLPEKFYQKIELFQSDKIKYPEDLALDQATGQLYTGLTDGRIVKITPSGDIIELAKSNATVLGLKLIKQRNQIIFVDLLTVCRLNLENNKIEILTNSYNGRPFKFLNNLDVANDGKVYFTQSSNKYAAQQIVLDLTEGRPYGEVYLYNPHTNQTTLILDNLYYANGILVTKDQKSLLISETFRFRISKYHLEGKQKGKIQIVLKNLPSNPDNIKFTQDYSELLIAFVHFRNFQGDLVLRSKFLRKLLASLPLKVTALLAIPKFSGGMIVDAETFKIKTILKESGKKLYQTTTLIKSKNNTLYFGSLEKCRIGKLNLQ